MQQVQSTKRNFIAIWAVVTLCKCVLAMFLPLFVDEAFYWQEGRHLAWAYSDLPGLTAWLARLGESIGGHSLFGLRWPFLLIAAMLPWRVAAMAAREFGQDAGWRVGMLATLLPLLGTLGVMALPDVPLALATVMCLDAGMRLMRGADGRAADLSGVDWRPFGLLATGLVIGGLTHYRFVAVIGVGFLVMLGLAVGRRVLRDSRLWGAVALGAVAWLPLLLWNLHNADAGLRFQLVDRHPWAFHPGGMAFLVVQALFVTPLLLWALVRAGWMGRSPDRPAAQRYLARSGLWVIGGFFLLGFFADSERVSFHWPVPAYLALLPLAPVVLDGWSIWWRRATFTMAMLGLLSSLGYYAAVSMPSVREQAAASKWYPSNFAGWDELAREVAAARATLASGTPVIADNFKIGAELGFATGNADIQVLDHPLNHHHGRAPQLALWGLQLRADKVGDGVALLVVGATDIQYREQLKRYHDLCAMVGPLPPPTVLNIDHGRQRFLLFRLPATRAEGPCVTPAMAWIDIPQSGATVPRRFELRGWAFKEGVGLAKVEALLNGKPLSRTIYGIPRPEVAGFWAKWRDGGSTDPAHPDVGFNVQINLDDDVPPGRHWLGLRLYGRDGSVEDWPEQPLTIQ